MKIEIVTVLTREEMKRHNFAQRHARRRARRKADGRKGRRNGPCILREEFAFGASMGFKA